MPRKPVVVERHLTTAMRQKRREERELETNKANTEVIEEMYRWKEFKTHANMNDDKTVKKSNFVRRKQPRNRNG